MRVFWSKDIVEAELKCGKLKWGESLKTSRDKTPEDVMLWAAGQQGAGLTRNWLNGVGRSGFS